METLQDNPGLANGKKRGQRPDICTIQVKEPKDASEGQRNYYKKVVSAKNHFQHRSFAVPGQAAPVVLGAYGCMAVLVAAMQVEDAGMDAMDVLSKAINGKKPEVKPAVKPEVKAEGEKSYLKLAADAKAKKAAAEGKAEVKPEGKGKAEGKAEAKTAKAAKIAKK